MKKAVMYGAGSIGRGFIGALFSEIGYEVVFIDVNDDVINLINSEKTYPQIIMNEKQPVHWITNIRAVDGKDPEAVSDEIATADIMATALGAAVLEKVAPVIAKGLLKRWDKDDKNTLDILICENLMDADVLLREYLLKSIPEEKHALFEQNTGIVETSIGRMVPPADPDLIPEDEHPLAVHVEPYDFLPVDKAAFKGAIPEYSKIVPYEPFHYYLERKLYVHNMAHVTTAFLGQFLNKTYIHEAADDIYIQHIVRGCMTESAIMLSEKYHVPFSDLNAHINDLLHRFRNSYLRDTVARVARDPMRKLQPSDRLVGAARSCEKMNITPVYLSFAIALALSFMKNEDSMELMENVCKIKKNEPLAERITYFYNKIIVEHTPLDEMIRLIDDLQSDIQGEII